MNNKTISSHPFIWGPALTVSVLAAVELGKVFGFTIPNPQLFTALAITFAAYSGGYPSGLIAAAIGVGYAFYFFSTPGTLFSYTDGAFLKVLVNCITLPGIPILVSELNKKYRQSIENEMGAFFENANSPAFSLDAEGRVTFWNQYLEDLTGYSKEELLEQRLQDHEVFRDCTEGGGDALTANFSHWHGELRDIPLRSRAGKPIDLLASATLQRRSGGKMRGLVCIGQDNTARKQAERMLAESMERYQDLLDLSPDGVMVHCNDTVVYCNQALATILGADSPEQIVGRSALSFVREEDQATVLARRDAVRNGEKLDLAEFPYLRLDGTLVHTERTFALINWEGQEAFLVLIRDITERRRAEMGLSESMRRYQTVVDVSPDGILVHRDEKIVFCNQAMAELLGAESVEQIIGRSIAEFNPPEEHAAISARRRAVRGG